MNETHPAGRPKREGLFEGVRPADLPFTLHLCFRKIPLISPTNVFNSINQTSLWVIAMSAPLDIDQLQTFVAIADTGSFTKAADRVFKTQSAVSMQMRRLEERVGKQLFMKDGRGNRLTAEGDA